MAAFQTQPLATKRMSRLGRGDEVGSDIHLPLERHCFPQAYLTSLCTLYLATAISKKEGSYSKDYHKHKFLHFIDKKVAKKKKNNLKTGIINTPEIV